MSGKNAAPKRTTKNGHKIHRSRNGICMKFQWQIRCYEPFWKIQIFFTHRYKNDAKNDRKSGALFDPESCWVALIKPFDFRAKIPKKFPPAARGAKPHDKRIFQLAAAPRHTSVLIGSKNFPAFFETRNFFARLWVKNFYGFVLFSS